MSRSKGKRSAQSRTVAREPARARPAKERAVSDLDRALASLAHEIRTPLNGILAFGELLMTSDLPERERAWAMSIRQAALHLNQLTTLVVDSAKAKTNGLALKAEPFALRELAEALAASFAARAAMKGLATKIEIAPALPCRVVGDAVRLRALIENLIDNAVKFTERGKVSLSFSAERAGRSRMRLVVEVADEGVGLSSAEIRRLFRPFSQVSAGSARRFGGAGLGLAFAARVAKAMRGTLSVASKPGSGSTFRLAVPLAEAHATPADGGRDAPSPAAPPAALRVLCAEDNPYGRVILNAILSELGHRSDFVGTGEAAVDAVRRGGYDAVLMDVTLAGMDGLEATRRLRALPGEGSRIPVIGLSGHASAQHEAAAREAGMNAYLMKPVSPRALAQAIASVRGA